MERAFLDRLLGLPRTRKRALQLAADALLIVLSFVAAMWLRLEHLAFIASPEIWLAFLPTLPFTLMVFWWVGLYRSVLRFITGQALVAIGTGVLVAAVTLALSAAALSVPIPGSVPIIFALLLFCAAGGARFAIRSLIRKPATIKRQPVIIYGAGDSGRQLHNALLHGGEYVPVAFVEDDPALQGTMINGCRVHAPSKLPRVLKNHAGAAILLAMPSASRTRRREIIAGLERLHVDIRTMPAMSDIVSGRASFSDLRRVAPEDLLGRDPIPPNPALMGQNVTGKVVLVSGAGGSIGSELCRQIIRYDPAALVLLDVSEFALYSIAHELRATDAAQGRRARVEPVLGSVQNPGCVQAVLRAFGVQTIYHAAANKHVAIVEENVVEGIRNNVFGTRVLADAAADAGVESFILVSSDKAVRPTNFMGASKRMAELICQAKASEGRATTFSMVRFGNVLGSSGSVIPRFRAQIEQGGPVTVTHRDITRYFMTITEAAQLVIQAGAMARGGDVFVLDMGEPVRIMNLAKSMIRLHGLKPYIMDSPDMPEPSRGDIGIQITGLNKGDKLYEELLIGNNPEGTCHPRILTATETALAPDELDPLLDRLWCACQAFDLPLIHTILSEAPTDFKRRGQGYHDLIWLAASPSKRDRKPALRAVGQSE